MYNMISYRHTIVFEKSPKKEDSSWQPQTLIFDKYYECQEYQQSAQCNKTLTALLLQPSPYVCSTVTVVLHSHDAQRYSAAAI